ncbi:hypothetical protein EET67_04810 [Pseudaminobacter arsenicus]|uniref:Uncharacterized protein n=1 Tax=Borborobacter arsenicus TaxID=1851146 RepID=A0A432V9W7_9HYPH|nr:DUF5996 family protein [Pseudaminobacter arsenicus]RUM98967.1 hypothetical protein EET67_04810 [Pseudaminobacter arsenicus]
MDERWPDIPYPSWRDTCTALHLYVQIVGKYRLARTPWINHAWQATFYPNARGFTTGLVPDGAGGIELGFDLIGHQLVGTSTDGRTAYLPLGPMSVASFHSSFLQLICDLGGTPKLHGRPNEVPEPIRFSEDMVERPYDADAVSRFFGAFVSASLALQKFRTSFLGKVSPVHFFWGSFDLAVTRFSSRPAPLHPGGIPALPDEITREAYSHEVSSAGFWPGGGGVDFPAFYSYAYPSPAGYADAQIEPREAYFDETLGEFLLPYDKVRQAPDPEAALMAFLESTYRAAADLAAWDVKSLECATGEPRRPRRLG